MGTFTKAFLQDETDKEIIEEIGEEEEIEEEPEEDEMIEYEDLIKE